tara:strand:- start:482 stop:706 length:225 start_codon:yes stop_codon:yes gene_type:complete
MAKKKKETAKDVAVGVAEGLADMATLGIYSVGKESLKSRACAKKGGVFKGGKCIPKSQIRKGKGKSRDWYPEKK